MLKSISHRKHFLNLVVFLSGFTALAYQLIWIKEFELFFGVHIFSVSAVLTAFMTGLAIGSLLFGRIADRFPRPILLFAIVELVLVLFAILFNTLLENWMLVYKKIVSHVDYIPANINFLRFIFAFIFLTGPAILIGGTMPLFMKISIQKISTLGMRTAKLYGFNNLGAFFGIAITGFVLVRFTGLSNSLYWIAGINFFNTFLIFSLSGQTRSGSASGNKPVQHDPPAGFRAPDRQLLYLVLGIFAIEGFTTLSYEVTWTRILTEFSYDKTGYLFTTILLSFIFGLSLGSFLISGQLDRRKFLSFDLSKIQIMIGLIAIIQLISATRVMPDVIESRVSGSSWFTTSGREYILIFIFLSIPVTFMGMTFPIVSRIYNDNLEILGRRFGNIGFLDTVGSIFGAFIAGFILLPLFGTRNSILFTAFLNIVPGLVLLYYIQLRQPVWKMIITTVVIIVFILGTIVFPGDPFYKTQIGKREGEQILFYEEGISGTVSVHSYGFNKRALAINGALYAFTNFEDARSHRMLGYMPFFYHENPKDVLVIGFGMGITGSTFRQSEIKNIDIAEINPAVIEASRRYFRSQNHNILEDDRLRIIQDDGRGWLVAGQEKYDIITCDATHPRFGDNLYTRDFYRICNEQLNEGGFMCNWMPFNWLNTGEYKSLVKAFIEVFPEVTMWYVNRGVCLLVGTDGEGDLDLSRLFKMFDRETVHNDFSEFDIFNPVQLISRYIGSYEEIISWCRNTPPNTDDRPFVEFGTVVSMAPDRGVLEWIFENMMEYKMPEIQPGSFNEIPVDRDRFEQLFQAYREVLISEIRNEFVRLPAEPEN